MMLPDEILQEARRLAKEAAAEWAVAKTDLERRAALQKNLRAAIKISQRLLGDDAAWLLWQLDAGLDDVEAGRSLPSWLKPHGERGKRNISATQSVVRGAYVGCVDVLLQQGYPEQEVISMVAGVAGISASQFRNFRKKLGDIGSEEAQVQRAVTAERFSKSDDPARAVCGWLANGRVPKIRF